MRLVRVSERRMSSCLSGSALNPSSTTTAATATAAPTYRFDHREIEIFKPTATSTRKSPRSSSPSSSLTSSSSPSSTISDASDSLSSLLSLCTRKPRTPRKRLNQTYNEAAALLSTVYPNIFSTKNLTKPLFKFSKRVETHWANPNSNPSNIGDDLLLPLSIPAKPINTSGNFEPTLASDSNSSSSNCTDTNKKPCQSSPVVEVEEEDTEFQFYQRNEEDDIDTESILEEEIGEGIDSIMGNLAVNNNNNNNNNRNHHQTRSNFCYGIPMGLGLLGSRFDFGFGMTRGMRAFRNGPEAGLYGGGGDDWWTCPVTTVEVEAISPRLERKEEPPATARNKPFLSEKKKSKKKKVKEEDGDKVATMGEVKESKASAAAWKGGESSATAATSGSGNRINLKLNYDGVLSAWSGKGSMFSEDFAASELAGSDASARLAQIDLFGENGGVREASVQRYKEKRRSRLFSKKIRYQVRKVNADQRPRMKGRFVRNPDSTGGGGKTL